MGQPAVIEKKQNGHMQIVSSLADLLRYNTYAMLGENVIVYENGEGGYVIFTIDPNAIYTKEDFMKLPEGAPFELLDGKLEYFISPTTLHQGVSGNISFQLFHFAKQQNSGTSYARLDVHFDKKNIVQPDIIFVSNNQKEIIKDWIFGAPNLIIEILSPSTEKKDKKDKFKLYQKHGVREYWMVDIKSQTVEMQILKGEKFVLKKKYGEGDMLKSDVVVGFEMAVDDIFEMAG